MSPKRKPVAFGLSAPLLAVGGAVLVLLGVAGGVGLDLMMQPEPPPPTPPRAPVAVNRGAPRPTIHLPEEEPSSPSVFSTQKPEAPAPRPAEPATGPESSSAPVPMLSFAVPSAVPPARPVLAIVIDDMGLDRPHTLQVIALPGPLTVSLMTYAPDLAGLAKQARAAGHELMVHVPMEPRDSKENPGPRALTMAMDPTEIRSTLAAGLDGWEGYVGINNHMGSRFTADRARMDVVMGELKRRGLLWLDSKTTTDSVGSAAARAAGVPQIERDVFLDNTQSMPAIRNEMEQAIATAKARGSAIAIGHPHEATIAALKEMVPSLAARGVALVPVTEVLKRRQLKSVQADQAR